MSSISTYTNKYHIKMAAPQGERVENFAGKDFLLSGGNLTWILTIQIFFRAEIKISKTRVYKEE